MYSNVDEERPGRAWQPPSLRNSFDEGDGTQKLPVKADLRAALGKEVGETVGVVLEERL